MCLKHRQESYNGEEARGETRDEIFARSGADNCVVGPGNGRPMIGSHHKAHLNELAGVPRQPVEESKNNDAQEFL